VDQNTAQQGYLTSEPYTIEKAGIKPGGVSARRQRLSALCGDLSSSRKTLKAKGEMIRKFITATAQGWKSYLKQPGPGNALIKAANRR
jgi:NitT/TauT family transport system substrate-binding protein